MSTVTLFFVTFLKGSKRNYQLDQVLENFISLLFRWNRLDIQNKNQVQLFLTIKGLTLEMEQLVSLRRPIVLIKSFENAKFG